jgi:hypothetical protein
LVIFVTDKPTVWRNLGDGKPVDEDAVEACPFDSFHEPAEYHGWWSAIEWVKQHQCSPTIDPEGTADEAWQEFIEQEVQP